MTNKLTDKTKSKIKTTVEVIGYISHVSLMCIFLYSINKQNNRTNETIVTVNMLIDDVTANRKAINGTTAEINKTRVTLNKIIDDVKLNRSTLKGILKVLQ